MGPQLMNQRLWFQTCVLRLSRVAIFVGKSLTYLTCGRSRNFIYSKLCMFHDSTKDCDFKLTLFTSLVLQLSQGKVRLTCSVGSSCTQSYACFTIQECVWEKEVSALKGENKDTAPGLAIPIEQMAKATARTTSYGVHTALRLTMVGIQSNVHTNLLINPLWI